MFCLPYKLMMIIYVSTNEAIYVLHCHHQLCARTNKSIYAWKMHGWALAAEKSTICRTQRDRESVTKKKKRLICVSDSSAEKIVSRTEQSMKRTIQRKIIERKMIVDNNWARLPPYSIYQLSNIIFSLSFSLFFSFIVEIFFCFDDDAFKFKLAGLDVRACVSVCVCVLRQMIEYSRHFFSFACFSFAVANH